MYTCLKLFFSISGTTVGWVFINYIEDINSMRKYNWAEAIRNTLMSSIEKYHKNPAKVTGCVMALLVSTSLLYAISLLLITNSIISYSNEKNSLHLLCSIGCVSTH